MDEKLDGVRLDLAQRRGALEEAKKQGRNAGLTWGGAISAVITGLMVGAAKMGWILV